MSVINVNTQSGVMSSTTGLINITDLNLIPNEITPVEAKESIENIYSMLGSLTPTQAQKILSSLPQWLKDSVTMYAVRQNGERPLESATLLEEILNRPQTNNSITTINSDTLNTLKSRNAVPENYPNTGLTDLPQKTATKDIPVPSQIVTKPTVTTTANPTTKPVTTTASPVTGTTKPAVINNKPIDNLDEITSKFSIPQLLQIFGEKSTGDQAKDMKALAPYLSLLAMAQGGWNTETQSFDNKGFSNILDLKGNIDRLKFNGLSDDQIKAFLKQSATQSKAQPFSDELVDSLINADIDNFFSGISDLYNKTSNKDDDALGNKIVNLGLQKGLVGSTEMYQMQRMMAMMQQVLQMSQMTQQIGGSFGSSSSGYGIGNILSMVGGMQNLYGLQSGFGGLGSQQSGASILGSSALNSSNFGLNLGNFYNNSGNTLATITGNSLSGLGSSLIQ